MRESITIKKVSNGYLLASSWREEVYLTLDEVFTALLQRFEGRTKSFSGDKYGRVTIERGKSDG